LRESGGGEEKIPPNNAAKDFAVHLGTPRVFNYQDLKSEMRFLGERIPMPCHALELLPITSLRPYGRNARTHSQKQIQQIANSIARFGFTNPVLIGDDGEILAGHGRVEAAKLLKIERVPALGLSHLNEADAAPTSLPITNWRKMPVGTANCSQSSFKA
jgi:ParB-like nuclease domain